MTFYPTAAAAQRAGFRACKRCRPDVTPGSPEWNVRADFVARAMRLIADGVVDRDGVGGLAATLGYSERQLERLLLAEVGAGPLALARAQRAQTARTLVETTELRFADIAFAAGFSSIRQFNDTIRAVFALTPTELRRRVGGAAPPAAPGTLVLRLPLRTPFCPENVFGHLVATAVPGVEEYRDGAYRRTLRLPNGTGIVTLSPRPDCIATTLVLDDLRDLPSAIARCRRLLDLDADPEAVADALTADPLLDPLVAKEPGRRVPRTVDENELAIRVVCGQQVSTAAARTHARRLVRACGTPIVDAAGGLTHLFPAPEALAELDPAVLRLPTARRQTIAALACGLASGEIDLGAGADWELARERLRTLAGIGDWTVEMIAMRALGDPDAFPAGDLGLRHAAVDVGVARNASALTRHAQLWRPWRAYATQYLWATQDHPINQWPPRRCRPEERQP